MSLTKIIGTGQQSVYLFYFPSFIKSHPQRWPCKIGHAKISAMNRIKSLRAGMIEQPIVDLIIKTNNATSLESYLHTELRHVRIKSYGDEWFLTNPAEVEDKYRKTTNKIIIGRKEFGHAVREARVKRRLTQTILAKQCSIRQATISKIESGIGDLSLTTVIKMLSRMKFAIEIVDKS